MEKAVEKRDIFSLFLEASRKKNEVQKREYVIKKNLSFLNQYLSNAIIHFKENHFRKNHNQIKSIYPYLEMNLTKDIFCNIEGFLGKGQIVISDPVTSDTKKRYLFLDVEALERNEKNKVKVIVKEYNDCISSLEYKKTKDIHFSYVSFPLSFLDGSILLEDLFPISPVNMYS
jgi:hypothetical protein